MLKITPSEYALMKGYIKDSCGIHLEKDKEYLIETRLSSLAKESNCHSFNEFYLKTKSDDSDKLKDRIIDAMTTNETYWFRDEKTWQYISEIVVPMLLEKARQNKIVRVWSAAASTGQEAYSLVMLLYETANKMGDPQLLDKIEIIGTDISTSALFMAIAGVYDPVSMERGISQMRLKKYFARQNDVWQFDPELKKQVTFKKFNLLNDFTLLGKFDLVLCRYVSIYFDSASKKELFLKIAEMMASGSILLLGATESISVLSDTFKINYYKGAVLYERL